MDFFLSFVAWCFILFVSLYAWSAYERRKEMLPKVLNFLSRRDASIKQKQFAKSAFEDVLSITLPLSLLETSILMANDDPEMTRVSKELDDMRESNPEAESELDEIYLMMFRLNIRFNFIIHALAFLCFKFSSRFRNRFQGQKLKNVISRAYVERPHC
ncbi:hypothetical protein N4G41_03690 [Kosakonia sacchari]|uniref:hypothetical protein n=1 Tax=Kosakonia sacchari TaxID=1158459 RepID=UPI002ACEFC48|nr:hypothetical protein [Kosakonia sacchari]MDZ7320731.1 hypothetical protein [Kosakonia sacchari]